MNLNHPELTLKIGQNGLETYWGMTHEVNEGYFR